MAKFELSAETAQIVDQFWQDHSKYTKFKGDSKIDLHDAPCLCQCETEEFFTMTEGESELRAFLMTSVFVDQMTYTHFARIYGSFSSVFRFPKLNYHPHVGMASPAWLISSSRGFDEKMDWKIVSRISINILNDLFRWAIQHEPEGDFPAQFLSKAIIEIETEFEHSSSRIFRQIVESAVANNLAKKNGD